MRHHFIQNNNHSTLTLLFAGWGMDEHPFAHYQLKESDFLVIYDYRTLAFDWSLLAKYEAIHVVAWSMGVWAAAHCGTPSTLPVKSRTAINGTPWPVDDNYGIAEAIFNGTLAGLNAATLRKFQLRMCGKADNFRHFESIAPQRSVEELKEELAAIGKACGELTQQSFAWDRAYVGENDLIFSAANQNNAWERCGVATICGEAAHYDEAVFKNYLKAI